MLSFGVNFVLIIICIYNWYSGYFITSEDLTEENIVFFLWMTFRSCFNLMIIIAGSVINSEVITECDMLVVLRKPNFELSFHLLSIKRVKRQQYWCIKS